MLEHICQSMWHHILKHSNLQQMPWEYGIFHLTLTFMSSHLVVDAPSFFTTHTNLTAHSYTAFPLHQTATKYKFMYRKLSCFHLVSSAFGRDKTNFHMKKHFSNCVHHFPSKLVFILEQNVFTLWPYLTKLEWGTIFRTMDSHSHHPEHATRWFMRLH
jgi:hypothetical protein